MKTLLAKKPRNVKLEPVVAKPKARARHCGQVRHCGAPPTRRHCGAPPTR